MSLLDISAYSKSEREKAESLSPAIQMALQTKFDGLREERRMAWLKSAMATVLEKDSAKNACLYWSQFADHAISQVCEKIKPSTPLAVFAFGKLGANELNLSSDVDLMIVSQEQNQEAQIFLRLLQKNLGDQIFRLDFDLRPGGRQGPLIPTVEQVEDYYGNYGETWERLAFVRLRPIWGNAKVIDSVMAFASRFSFRKHLDFSLLEDLKILRQKIHAQYWHRSQNQQIDLKLGVGGIRDLELFVHALLVVHGGRNPDLHVKGTEEALQKISQYQILGQDEVSFLIQHYWNLRQKENFVQAFEDRQTHIYVYTQENDEVLSIKNDMARCDQIVSSLLGRIDHNQRTLPADMNEQMGWLMHLGFSKEVVEEHWPDFISLSALSRNKERDEQYRQRFLYLFIESLAKQSTDLDRSFLTLKDFLKSTRAKSSFYNLFLNHENLIEQTAQIFATSPYFARILCGRPELIDSLVSKKISVDMSEDLSSHLDYLSEQKMLLEILSGMQFLSEKNLAPLYKNLTEQADKVASALLLDLKKEFPSSQLEILALGKWGGQELGFQSDLDLIFVSPVDPTEEDLKLAKRWVNRITEQRKGGPLYSVDFRLKPSGKGGLIVTSLKQLEQYILNDADAWERQAYLKSRWLTPQTISPAAISAARGIKVEELAELERIRTELLKNKRKNLDLKYAEGGLVDIEFAVQILVLSHKTKCSSAQTSQMIDDLKIPELKLLGKNYEFLRLLEQIYQLTATEAGSILSEKSLITIAQILGQSASELEEKILNLLTENAEQLKRLDPRRKNS